MKTAEAYIKGIDNLPTLPEIAQKIIELTDGEAPNINEVADLIQKDPAITVNLLKIINSGYYSLRKEVISIRQAVVLLGLGQVRNLVVTMVTVNHFKETGKPYIRLSDFWNHSLSVATIAQSLGVKFNYSDTGDLYLCGLLHDMGKLILQLYYPEDTARIVAHVDRAKCSMHQAELATLGFSHAELGGWLMTKWNFPDRIKDGVFHHHDCRKAGDRLFTAIIEFSDMAVKSRLFAVHGDQFIDFIPEDHPSWQVIRDELSARDDIDFVRVFIEMDDEIEKARELAAQARSV